MDIKAIENIETAKEITKIIDEAFSPSYMYYDVWGVIKGEWKEEIAVKDEAYSLLFQIQKINRLLHGDNITISEYVPNLHERSDLMTKRSDLAVKVKSLLEGKTQQNNDNKQPQQETEREKEYFAKAIQAGLMKKDGENYKWLHNNGLQSSLGYFLKMVFNPKGTAQIHYKRMENLFKVSRLDSAIDRALSVKKPQKWRKEIDVLFDD